VESVSDSKCFPIFKKRQAIDGGADFYTDRGLGKA